jgi:ATP-dependent Lon protease
MPTSPKPRKRLPKHPSEENLRKQAKGLAKEQGLQLAAAQRELAIEYGFRNWAELMEAVGASERLVPFLPLRELVAFPHEIYPIYIGRPKSIRAIEAAAGGGMPILMVAQKDAKLPSPAPSDMYDIGTLGTLNQWLKLGDGTIKAEVVGSRRARVTRFVFDQEFTKAEYVEVAEAATPSEALDATMRAVIEAFDAYQVHERRLPLETANAINLALAAIGDSGVLADKIGGHLKLPIAEKQALLEMLDPVKRLEEILGHLKAG